MAGARIDCAQKLKHFIMGPGLDAKTQRGAAMPVGINNTAGDRNRFYPGKQEAK